MSPFPIANYTSIEPYYIHPNGAFFNVDCIDWLKSLKSESVDLVFADPPYNIGKASWNG